MRIAALTASMLLFHAPVALASILCPPMPSAITEVNRDVKSDIKGNVASLGKIKAGEVAIKTEVVVKNLFAKYPNVEKILVLQTMMATYCTMLQDTKSLSEKEKLNRWEKFQEKILNLQSSKSNKYNISDSAYNKLLDITGGQTRTIEALVGQLSEKDKTIKERDEKIEILGQQYSELKSKYETNINKEDLSKEDKANLAVAKEKLDDGDLKGAKKILVQRFPSFPSFPNFPTMGPRF